MEENALKGDIYNGSDFTARKELRGSRCLKSRGRTGDRREEEEEEEEERRRCKKKKGKEAQEHSRVEYEVGRRRRDGT